MNILSLACILSVSVGRVGLAGDTSADVRAVLALEEEWRGAQMRNDTVAFHRLLAPELTFIGTSGSLRDVRGYIESRTTSWIPRASTYTITECRVRIYGSVAVVTGRGETTGVGVAATVRFTDVWVRKSDVWQMVASQRTDLSP